MRSVVLVLVVGACHRDVPARSAPTRPDLSRATRAIITSLDSGDDESIAQYLDTGTITIEWSCPVCDDPEGTGSEASTRLTDVLGRAAFITFVQGAEQRLERGPYSFHAPRSLTCDERCCAGPTGELVPNQLYVTEVCFRPGGKLASITYLDATE